MQENLLIFFLNIFSKFSNGYLRFFVIISKIIVKNDSRHKKVEENNMSSEMERDIITLEFEDSEAVECEVVGVFEAQGQEYVALVSVESMEKEDSEVFIYRYKELDGDEFEMEDITDDAEFEMAVKELSAILGDEE